MNKETKKQFEELKENKKIVVEVKQNNEVVNYWLDEKTNVMQLLGLLYRKTIQKSSLLKIKHSYNYADLQTITFIDSYDNFDGTTTKTSYIFYNIPTNLGYLDTYKINEII